MSLFERDRSAERLPVSVVTGFLGSGKTTILRHLLRQPAMADSAVIINELGEVGLDHLLVERIDGETVLLPSGCLCCALRSDLEATLRTLVETARKLGDDIWLEAVIQSIDGFAAELSTLGRWVDALERPFATVLVSPAPDLKCTLPGSAWPDAPPPRQMFEAARRAFPGARIGGMPQDTYVVPDCVITRQGGIWKVSLAGGRHSSLTIHRGYEQMLQHAAGADAGYLRGRLQEARWLLKNIEARGETGSGTLGDILALRARAAARSVSKASPLPVSVPSSERNFATICSTCSADTLDWRGSVDGVGATSAGSGAMLSAMPWSSSAVGCIPAFRRAAMSLVSGRSDTATVGARTRSPIRSAAVAIRAGSSERM